MVGSTLEGKIYKPYKAKTRQTGIGINKFLERIYWDSPQDGSERTPQKNSIYIPVKQPKISCFPKTE